MKVEKIVKGIILGHLLMLVIIKAQVECGIRAVVSFAKRVENLFSR